MRWRRRCLSVGAARLEVGGRPDPKQSHTGDPSRIIGAVTETPGSTSPSQLETRADGQSDVCPC